MKPIELLKLWSDLQASLPLIPDEKKAAVLRDVLRNFPPAMLSQCLDTYETVRGLIEKELETYGKAKDQPEDGPKERDPEVRPRERQGSKQSKVRKQQ